LSVTTPAIAIVGLGCIFPDARTPVELWENVLAQRRAFRRLPPERLRADDYCASDPAAPDRTYSSQAALIADYEFDRVAFKVVGSTFRSADLAHWLALDVAARALADAGFPDGRGLPREATGVLVGNTLTGEFSRANGLRLRWPYVRRVVEAALARQDWPATQRRMFLEGLEADYKSPFPPVGEETLAGGLSNTIAGRICNQFDLKGGGYTLDGACASSLLAVANACAALVSGDLEVALAGGIDLSLDPFELVGFAKTGALAVEEMRVFDRHSAGFWPGEGCGFVVLMRQADAQAQGCRAYATIRGWGISSDGSGGITRPEAEGQLQALRRAYRRAGFGAETVAYFEGHGTGTAVGDATELEVLSRARRDGDPSAAPAAIGSIKANIGHTKAAAGIAGLLKATMALHTEVLPPTTGCHEPHPQLTGTAPALRPLREPEPWPARQPLRAAVSAMGFGGINTHLVLEKTTAERRRGLGPREQLLARSSQDVELFLLADETPAALRAQLEQLIPLARGLSRAELADAAEQLARKLIPKPVRAAVVASKPAQLVERMQTLLSWLDQAEAPRFRSADGIFLGAGSIPPRLAFLFPGQGSPTNLEGGIWRRRFEAVRQLYATADLPTDGDMVSTRVMQPAVITASMAGLKSLETLGLNAEVGIGHSLGELTAYHWAGMLDEGALLRIARARGAAMADLGGPTGAMLALAERPEQIQALLQGEPVWIVGYNSPRQTVVAGEADAVNRVAERARAAGVNATRLAVSHAFHTPLVAAAVPVLAECLARENFGSPRRQVISTISGSSLTEGEDCRALLARQVTAPVQFSIALGQALRKNCSAAPGSPPIDLLVEVGPGNVLTSLAKDMTDCPALALDAGGPSLNGLLQVTGAAFALGAPIRPLVLFADRFTRPFDLGSNHKFFANPCELAPLGDAGERLPGAESASPEPTLALLPHHSVTEEAKPLELVRQLVAARAELPVAAVLEGSRMLSDLHLNSITVGQLLSEATRRLGLPRVVSLTDFANASVGEMAAALLDLQRAGRTARSDDSRRQPPGVDIWFESFTVELVAAPRRAVGHGSNGRHAPGQNGAGPGWQVFAPKDHALASELAERLSQAGGGGVLLCLPAEPGPEEAELLLAAARAVQARSEHRHLVLVQHGWGGGGFARTLHLETPGLSTCIVNVPIAHSQAADWVAAEVAAAKGAYVEAYYDPHGNRYEPRLTWLPPAAPPGERVEHWPIGADDVLLVTGGGRGIAAECALALGQATGARLALLGRSATSDRELAANLARFAAAGVKCRYVRADVTDARAVRAAVAEAEAALGRITAFLHGAGANAPQLIAALDTAAFQRTAAPKVAGARNVLAALDPDRLRLFLTFGSIIARAGLRGEADYAAANEWLTALTEQFKNQHPQCRCLALEWSVWSGVGMGERLGRVDSLIEHGIMPMPPDEGVRVLLQLVREPSPAVAVVVTGRFGEPPTLQLERSPLPLHRFLERPRVHYPGVELILDTELSLGTDPYLDDHVLQNQRLLPAVLGLEAMAQAAMALTGSAHPPSFERVELARPVGIAADAPACIRLAALRRGADHVEVCLRSAETDYHVDHFRALCRFEPNAVQAPNGAHPLPQERGVDLIPLDPQRDLYGSILFHRGRFRRLRGYRLLTARECVAEILPSDGLSWFGPYLPAGFVLGDPAARDAALHAIQACIPHQRLLPTGIDRLTLRRLDAGPHVVHARERLRDGSNFVYDLQVTAADGQVLEQWEGLRLRAVGDIPRHEPWPEELLGPYLERRFEELAPESARIVLARSAAAGSPGFGLGGSRCAVTDAALQQALGEPGLIWRRPDGKPVVPGGSISAAHCAGLTLALSGTGRVACDLETVVARPETVWWDLLGPDWFGLAQRLAHEQSEAPEVARTRLWTAVECLKKAGLPANAPLVLGSTTADGWVVLRAGTLLIASYAARVRSLDTGLAVAIAVEVPLPAGQGASARAQPVGRA